MTNPCDKCKHTNVCKYKEELNNCLNDIDKIAHGDFMTIKVECIYRDNIFTAKRGM